MLIDTNNYSRMERKRRKASRGPWRDAKLAEKPREWVVGRLAASEAERAIIVRKLLAGKYGPKRIERARRRANALARRIERYQLFLNGGTSG